MMICYQRTIKTLCLIYVLLIASFSLFAQSYNFRHYQVEDGLAHNTVICSLQDRYGFMWFGTKNGLNRFDGYRFSVYRHDPEQAGSLGHNFIHSLLEDENGFIWVGTLKGLYIYDPSKDTFACLTETKGSDIASLQCDRDGNIWFVAGNMLQRYNPKRQELTEFEHGEHGEITSVIITKDNAVWVSTAQGFLQRHDDKTGGFESFDVFDGAAAALTKWIEKIEDTGDGQLFVATASRGIKLFDLKTHQITDIPIKNTDQSLLFARDFLKTDTGEYWIATESGIFVYTINNHRYTQLRNRTNDNYSLSDNAVYTLTKDKEGGIWCGTYFGGLSYYPRPYTAFDTFYPKSGENSIQGDAVREIVKDENGNFWIGTEDGGLNKFNPQTNAFENLTTEKNGISHSNIHGLALYKGRLWIGTFEHGLDVLDIGTNKVVKKYKAGPAANQLKSNFTESLIATDRNGLLVGTAVGLYRYNEHTDDFILLNDVPGNKHYSALVEDSDGTIWAGTLRDGLYFFNSKTNQSGSYLFDVQDTSSLSSNEINGLFIDSDRNLWVTTENGLCVMPRGSKTFKRYTTKNNFPTNTFYKILEDSRKNLWISTAQGLVVFHPKTGKILTYSKSNGLLSNQFNYGSAFKDDDGKMYFGSLKGMISFYPASFQKNRAISKVYFTGFQINNKEVDIGVDGSPLSSPISFTKTIRLNHNQANFSIDFAALGFTAPDMIQYSFIMEGIDDHWTHLKTNRKVYFTDLSPGRYIFKVKAFNSGVVEHDSVTQLEIIISPPLWASTSALLVYALLVVGVGLVIIRNYHKRVLHKHKAKMERWETQKEKELYRAKINFFTQVTHEIRTPLTLIHGPLEDLLHTCEDTSPLRGNLMIMKKNTDRLLELSRQLMDFRKAEQKGFNLSFVQLDVHALIKEICTRFQPAVDDRSIIMDVELGQGSLLVYADAEALTKIVSNLVDNALKYALSKVSIRTSVDDEQFKIVVTNDGDPIPYRYREKIFEPFFRLDSVKTKSGSGIGLSLAKSLTELHKGSLTWKMDAAGQTCFELSLPKYQEHRYTLDRHTLSAEELVVSEIDLGLTEHDLPVILIVEDDAEVRNFTSNILKRDFIVYTADNGQAALDLLEQVSVQLIVSDVMMAGMDGFELCKSVKMNVDHAHIPVVLLTAKNSLQAKIEGLEVGADAYIEKPYSPNHLLTQIVNLLTVRDKIKNHYAQSPLAHIKSMAYNKADEAFLEKINDTIVKNMDNTTLDVDFLADVMNMSRSTLYRKTKAISNLSPHELINITRLKHAASLLAEGHFKILKIASITGFSSSAQFARSFAKQFGMAPSEYVASLKNKR
ncbi:hybrid sensor histidine kinase/response regulator transcription factor [Sphingobacterium haloxyli]|uniref:histidine kinase n=1 Tax=Sphingobacterium haloxyli TaxID=2100533 RepID=A0A2S9J254_9SPHI|nr:hybrid sensor histidine kinase/response regulator transcription factor [Sphingobacterium haloxyli]PRD46830.1 hybrid sensor histidine kinase/response regulator [Sphingobacterium haloxyli]